MPAKTLALILLPLLFFTGYFSAGAAAEPIPAVAAWVYSALSALEEAGLLPEYPAEWIAAGHLLSRHECALYLRSVLLRLGEREREGAGDGGLSNPVELALTKLVEEFAPELRVLGVEVGPWSGDGGNRSVYIDLDDLFAVIAERPEAPPINGPPFPQTAGPSEIGIPDRELILDKKENGSNTYRLLRPESFSIPLHDFRKYPNSLIGLAGEVLGLEWVIDLAPVSSQPGLGIPLRLGGFAISDESEWEKIRGGFGLRLGEGLGFGFDALWFLDLDEAQFAMNRFILDLNTQVPLGERTGIFGGLSLEYRDDPRADQGFGSQAIAGLRILLDGDLYLVAEYSLANPFSPTLPHSQGPSVGLGLGEIGLILLGIQTPTYVHSESLELTGLFIYRF